MELLIVDSKLHQEKSPKLADNSQVEFAGNRIQESSFYNFSKEGTLWM